MMAGENRLRRDELDQVRRALDAAERTDRLMAASGNPSDVGFSELYAYATQADRAPRRELLVALDADACLRRKFEALLRETSMYHLPRVAAAAASDISRREAEGCRISLRSSRAEESQVFVIIELSDPAARPGSLFVCGKDRGVRRVDLSEPRDGRIQLLLENDSDIVQGLRDIETEVFLR